MRSFAGCFVALVVVLVAAPLARSADLDFTVVPAQSEVMVTITLDTPVGADTDSDMSMVTGTISGVVESPTEPFGSFQIVDLQVATAEPTSLNFCLVNIVSCLAGVDVTADAGDITVAMITPGPAATVTAGDFTQVDNELQVVGGINVTATGLAVGQVPDGPYLLNSDPLPNDLSGTLVRVGDTFTLTLDLVADGMVDDPDTGVLTTFSMTGTIVATAPAPVIVPGDLDCSGDVTIADAPLLITALLDPETFTGCDIDRADVNNDGSTDGRDIGAFVAALLGN